MVSSITQAFHLELIKLPTQVKQMSLSRFQEEFGDSLAAVARGAINGGTLGPPLSNRTNNIPIAKTTTNPYGTVSKSTKSTSKVFETPSSNKTNGGTQLLSTAMRQPREGEKIVSANGSPLGDFQTVVKAPKPAGRWNMSSNDSPFLPYNVIPMQLIILQESILNEIINNGWAGIITYSFDSHTPCYLTYLLDATFYVLYRCRIDHTPNSGCVGTIGIRYASHTLSQQTPLITFPRILFSSSLLYTVCVWFVITSAIHHQAMYWTWMLLTFLHYQR